MACWPNNMTQLSQLFIFGIRPLLYCATVQLQNVDHQSLAVNIAAKGLDLTYSTIHCQVS